MDVSILNLFFFKTNILFNIQSLWTVPNSCNSTLEQLMLLVMVVQSVGSVMIQNVQMQDLSFNLATAEGMLELSTTTVFGNGLWR